MRGTGLTIGELAALKAIERKGFRVDLTRHRDGQWCCQVWNSDGGICYWADTHSDAIRMATEGTNRDDFRRRFMGEEK